MSIHEMPHDLTPRERFGMFVGLLHAFVAEAGFLGLILFLWVLYTTLRRR